jgi:sugar phosphate isomerase/epimerase
MLLVCPDHTPEFLSKHNLGIEAHIGRSEQIPEWEKLVPFVHGVHLPYAHLNLAALDDELRKTSIEKIKEAIAIGCQYPVDKMVMHTVGIEVWGGGIIGSYERMIDGMRELADFSLKKGITLCVENSAMHIPERIIYGVSAQEWISIQKDVNRPNVLLTLDVSHAAAAAAYLMKDKTDEDRFNYIYEFLNEPELIGRVHWSDSRLTGGETYMRDMHVVVGDGDIPVDFHRKIKNLDAVKLLEHNQPEDVILREIAYIDAL